VLAAVRKDLMHGRRIANSRNRVIELSFGLGSHSNQTSIKTCGGIGMRRFVAAFFVSLGFCVPSFGQNTNDVNWCLTGDAPNMMKDQPMDRGYCAWAAAGTAVGVWYGSREAQWVASMTQKGWSQKAARELACSNNPDDWAKALGLIAACQCHNQSAADWVIDHPDQVLPILRS